MCIGAAGSRHIRRSHVQKYYLVPKRAFIVTCECSYSFNKTAFSPSPHGFQCHKERNRHREIIPTMPIIQREIVSSQGRDKIRRQTVVIT